MDTKDKIITYIQKHGPVSGRELAVHLGFTRQAINKHTKKLIQSGQILKSGITRGARYLIPQEPSQFEQPVSLKKKYLLKNLEEDVVCNEISLLMNLKDKLARNAYALFRYAFSEILNNAIEHSQSDRCSIVVSIDNFLLTFTIRDYGIGIFYSIADKFHLPNEITAMGELIKGKRTTMPDRHTGEGVFFSSKSGDVVQFKSHRICIVFDNQKKNVFVEEKRNSSGTEVIFKIKKNTRRKLDSIFKEYAPEDYEYRFEKTRVHVKLYQSDHISRSEARRLLAGLDSFQEIILDFKGVKSLGQGFADEIFRVFLKSHPYIKINVENLSDTLKPVIDHVS